MSSKVLFDLGVPPDINSFSPAIVKKLKDSGWSVRAKHHVADILKENGVDPSEISSIIRSHWHWDHIGGPSTFPGSTQLIVGPGFKNGFLPGYPTQPESPVCERYFEGRNVVEIDFPMSEKPLKVGAFPACDFFGDGSFYLLDSPGHAIGYIAGLARTTSNPDTFTFMGGDLCHHGAEMRPSPHLSILSTVSFPTPDAQRSRFSTCPGCKLFEELNIKRGRKPNEPYFEMSHAM